MDAFLDYLAARLSEPSTYVSLGSLTTAMGFMIAPDHWQTVSFLGMGIGGVLGMVLRERKKTTATEIKSVVETIVKPEVVKPVAPAVLDEVMKQAENGKGA